MIYGHVSQAVNLLVQDDIDEVNKIAHNLKARLDYLQKLNEQALKRKVCCTDYTPLRNMT